MKPLVYVAGPITSAPFASVRQANDAFTWLRSIGCVPFCPQFSVVSEMVTDRHYEEWMAYDFDVIENCAALLALPGDSPGRDSEVEFANKLGLPVFLFDTTEDRQEMIAWVGTR